MENKKQITLTQIQNTLLCNKAFFLCDTYGEEDTHFLELEEICLYDLKDMFGSYQKANVVHIMISKLSQLDYFNLKEYVKIIRELIRSLDSNIEIVETSINDLVLDSSIEPFFGDYDEKELNDYCKVLDLLCEIYPDDSILLVIKEKANNRRILNYD